MAGLKRYEPEVKLGGDTDLYGDVIYVVSMESSDEGSCFKADEVIGLLTRTELVVAKVASLQGIRGLEKVTRLAADVLTDIRETINK